MNIGARRAGPPPCPLIASQSAVSCNFEQARFPGALRVPASRGPRCRSRLPRASAPRQLRCPRCRSCRSRTAHSHLARAPRAAPPLSLPMRPALSSHVGAALPEPPLLSLARPALSSRVSLGAAHSALTRAPRAFISRLLGRRALRADPALASRGRRAAALVVAPPLSLPCRGSELSLHMPRTKQRPTAPSLLPQAPTFPAYYTTN